MTRPHVTRARGLASGSPPWRGWWTAVLLAAVTPVAAACGATAPGPPAIVVDRTACSHCGMLVSEPMYAAAYHVAGREPRVFDDIGCLIDAARSETTPPIAFWFHDAAGGGWTSGETAIFVVSPDLRTPMGAGVLAYADAAAAQAAAAALEGEIVRTLPELLARQGAPR
jgi:copper chaperone NosL